MKPISTQIEFGNISEANTNDVLVKEKKGKDGTTVFRIYQRKDLESITNPFDRIKKTLKYTLEDFGRDNEVASRLLEKVGFGKVKILRSTECDNLAGLLETIRSGARTGLINNELNKQFKNVLSANNISQLNEFRFYENIYSDHDFKSDLNYITQSQDTSSWKSIIEKSFEKLAEIAKNPSSKADDFEENFENLHEIRENIINFFMEKKTKKELVDEFDKKFFEMFYEPLARQFGGEKTKNWIIAFETESGKDASDGTNIEASLNKKTTIDMINISFSNHWWDNDEKKMTSLVHLLNRYSSLDAVPSVIRTYILFKILELSKKNPHLHALADKLNEQYADQNTFESEI